MNDSHDLEPREARLPLAHGRPAITQGRYGDRGNLELVFADPRDGLWVSWFNADDPATVDIAPGARAGEWSGGLHFAAGQRYDAVSLIQATRGPDFLELVAATDSAIEHWTWTPQEGFARRGLLPAVERASKPSIGETPNGFVVAAVGGSRIWRWAADVAGTQWSEWNLDEAYSLPEETTAATVRVDPAGHIHAVVAIDGTAIASTSDGHWTPPSALGSGIGHISDVDVLPGPDGTLIVVATDQGVLAGRMGELQLLDDIGASAVCIARSRMDEERMEIVVRDGSGLRHLRTTFSGRDGLLDTSIRTIESKVHWPADAPIHRRG